MDPVSMATTAVAFLSPYLVKAGEKAAENIGEKLPAQVGKVWTAITSKFRGRPSAEKAVTDWVAQPEDTDNEAAFRKELRDVLKADRTFLTELSQLLTSVQPESRDTVVNIGSGVVATGDSVVAGPGGVAVGRDVHGSITINAAKKSEK
jgi:hypothetical protein